MVMRIQFGCQVVIQIPDIKTTNRWGCYMFLLVRTCYLFDSKLGVCAGCLCQLVIRHKKLTVIWVFLNDKNNRTCDDPR